MHSLCLLTRERWSTFLKKSTILLISYRSTCCLLKNYSNSGNKNEIFQLTSHPGVFNTVVRFCDFSLGLQKQKSLSKALKLVCQPLNVIQCYKTHIRIMETELPAVLEHMNLCQKIFLIGFLLSYCWRLLRSFN